MQASSPCTFYQRSLCVRNLSLLRNSTEIFLLVRYSGRVAGGNLARRVGFGQAEDKLKAKCSPNVHIALTFLIEDVSVPAR